MRKSESGLKPLEVAVINGVESQTCEMVGVYKMPSPFTRSTKRSSVHKRLESIISSMLSTNPISQTLFTSFRMISSLSLSTARDEYQQFIFDKVTASTATISADLTSSKDIHDFCAKADQLFENLELFSKLFSNTFRCDFLAPFYGKLKDELISQPIIQDAITSVVQMISRDENRGLVKTLFRFLDVFKLLSESEILADVARSLMMHIHTKGSSVKDRQKMFAVCFAEYSRFCALLPTLLRDTISEGFSTTLIKGDMKTFTEGVASYLLDECEDWAAYIYSVANPLHEVVQIAERVKRIEYDADKIIRIYNAVSRLPECAKEVITVALRAKVGDSDSHFATRIANNITEAADAESYAGIINCVELLTLIQNRMTFERIYTKELLNRAVENRLSYDRVFVREFTRVYGMEESVQFRSLIADYDEGVSFVRSIRHQIPDNLDFTVLARNKWVPSKRAITYPAFISGHLEEFARAYKQEKHRSIEFDATLSQVELLWNDAFVIKCDGVTATILLALNEGLDTIAALVDATGLSAIDIETSLNALRSSKCGNLVEGMRLSIPDKKGEQIIGSTLKRSETVAMQTESIAYLMSENAQIEALVLRHVKSAPMNIRELFSICQARVQFNLTEETFNRCLRKLQDRQFIACEGESIKYIP